MKKIVLSIAMIAVIALCSFGFAACNNATVDGMLENVWQNFDGAGKESYVYDVTSSTSATGTYNVSVEYFAGKDVVLSDATTVTNCKKGYLIKSSLVMSDGYTSDSACFFEIAAVSGASTTFFRPVASYKTVAGSSADFRYDGTYSGSTFSYALTTADGTQNGSVDVGSKYYDNNEFHQVVRSVSNSYFESGFTLSYNVAVVNNGEIASAALTATGLSAKEDVESNVVDTEGKKVAYSCHKVNVSRSTKVNGATQSMWYANDNINNLRHVLVKIVEPTKDGETTYLLKSYSYVI